MDKKPERKSHAERTRETRNLLVEETLNCLQEFGYHGTSISRILKKAGISKGAWNHHFHTKKELIAAAIEAQLQWAISTGREALKAIDTFPEEDRFGVILDYFWENFEQGRRRDVWLEVYIACRTDKELQNLVNPVIEDFQNSLNSIWREHFVTVKESDSSIEGLMNLTLFVTRGMAIQSLFVEEPEYYRAFRDQWVSLMKPMIKLKKL